ncbi:MAG: DNA adenine methylase [Bacteroidetes bacterium]|nr:DNA adenine methylase [Bacteroidota bacterium]
MKVPHPIPYQGSKRNLAKYILPFFPLDVDMLIEPFSGSAAITIAAAQSGKASLFHINDINEPLVSLFHEIVNDPQKISNNYEKLWKEQLGCEREYYDQVRDLFNKAHKPEHLLYLLVRCVKASIRYNSNGEFNQSPDNRRKGRKPKEMRNDIFSTSHLLKNRITITSRDYKEILPISSPRDLVYLDPPYQGVCSNRDPRYIEGIHHAEFIEELKKMNERNISFILSYDGKRGSVTYGETLPKQLELYKYEIKVGRSSQSTLLGHNDYTYESLYLSKSLQDRLASSIEEIIGNIDNQFQLQF